jgi:uncharacterized protein (TIGR00251 family)
MAEERVPMTASDLQLRETPDGVVLPVQAQPGARRNALVGLHGGRLKVAVTQVAEKGKANQALTRLIADELGLSKSQVSLIAGETTARKDFLVVGVSHEALRTLILDRLS